MMIMNKGIIRNKWTEEHITYLKMEYLQGSSLKKIAMKLNRSVSAINKVLARHNLRTHSKMERIPIITMRSNNHVIRKKMLRARNRNKGIPVDQQRQEVPFEGVLYWLMTQNIHVKKSSSDVYYEMYGRPMNKQQILFQANLLREQLHLPIFWVQHVTYS